jgi:putative transposase
VEQLSRECAGQTEARLRPHPTYLSLGTHPDERRAASRDLLDAGLCPRDAEAPTLHTHQQKPWGSERFKSQLEVPNSKRSGSAPSK